MNLVYIRPVYKFGAALALLSLSACGWVDSTGTQQNAAPPVFIDPSFIILTDGESFSVNENTQRVVAFDNADSDLSDWRWRLLDGQANIRSCARFDEFELRFASNTLHQSCAISGSCEIDLKEQTDNNVTSFSVTTPLMRAPAALEFQFTARNSDGKTVERRQLLCAIPINEAPDAVDDEVSVTRGSNIVITGDNDQSLLANDQDDEDVRNLGLSVSTTPVEGPLFAANFQLFTDGGFIYEPRPDAPLSKNGSISDRFVYSVTDGFNTNTATVSIRITEFNTAPTLITALPEFQATISGQDEEVTLFNLRNYFIDAENDTLGFTALASSLPASGNIYLTNDGLLKGSPTGEDSGRYFVEFSVADSIASVDTNFYLNIARSNGDNRAPYADDIINKTVTGQFSYDISGFFGDPDEDQLSFTTTELPAGIEISPAGVIFGTSAADNRGLSFIRVIANDGNGGTTSDGFLLRIR